jgi:adenine-specific DNA-methyltransferase
MEKRLRLAKRLLKPDGVLIVTVDENEVHHLAVLLEEKDLFREYLRYMVTILINPKGTAKANFGRVEEHAIFVVPNLDEDVISQLPPPEDAPDAALTIDVDDEDPGEGEIWIRELTPAGDLRLPPAIAREIALNGDGSRLEITVNDGVAELRPLDEEDDVEPDEKASSEKEGFSVLHLRRRGAESSFRKDRWRQFYAINIDTKAKKVVGVGPRFRRTRPTSATNERATSCRSIRSTRKETSGCGGTAATRCRSSLTGARSGSASTRPRSRSPTPSTTGSLGKGPACNASARSGGARRTTLEPMEPHC